MCGIAGWLDWERDLADRGAVVDSMASAVESRGPDGRGVWTSGAVALAHRRLSVIDPEGGGQPMVYRKGNSAFVLVYNGELYNFTELRRELEGRGYVFRTRSDTEVLLLSYVEWGATCVERFLGIFAFGIWDEARKRLFLARDQLGVKPLFYTQRGSATIFGSELKALLRHPLVPPEVDAEGLAEILP